MHALAHSESDCGRRYTALHGLLPYYTGTACVLSISRVWLECVSCVVPVQLVTLWRGETVVVVHKASWSTSAMTNVRPRLVVVQCAVRGPATTSSSPLYQALSTYFVHSTLSHARAHATNLCQNVRHLGVGGVGTGRGPNSRTGTASFFAQLTVSLMHEGRTDTTVSNVSAYEPYGLWVVGGGRPVGRAGRKP